jgi:ATP/maltotriose-dependent transcriptional regulator MalT
MEGSPPERDVLLATKLQVPRSRPGLVPRRRLADRLEEGLNRGLVLVAAPGENAPRRSPAAGNSA